MAEDKIVISAIARVVDMATKPLQAIQKVIGGVAETAAKTGSAVSEAGGKMASAFGGLAGRVGTAASKIGNFARSTAGLIGPIGGLIGLAGIGGLTAGITDFIAKSKEIMGAATRLGVSTDAIQTFANVFGDSTERASEAMGSLQKTLAMVQRGGKGIEQTTNLLRKMGFTAQEIKLGNLETMLPVIMESFKNTKDPILRANMALKLFGKSGQQLIPFLIKGKEGFADARAEMERLGFTFDDLKAGLEGGQALKDLGNVIDNVRGKIAAEILPVFTSLVKGTTEWVKANRELLKQVALPAFIGAIAASVIGLGLAVAAALGPWTLLAGAIVAGGVAIYQNWDDLIAWMDKEIPGLTTMVSKAASDMWAFAKQAAQNIRKGFQEGGLAGGFAAYLTEFKNAYVGVLSFIVNQFMQVDWGAVGKAAGDLLWQALIAGFHATVQVGQFIIDQFNAALSFISTLDWASVGKAAGVLFVQAWIATFKALWDVNVWLAGLVVQMANYLSTVDWMAVFKGLMLFWPKLYVEMIRIGSELLKGLIDGMISAIPGLDGVISKIGEKMSKIGSWFKGVGISIADAAGEAAARMTAPYGQPQLATPVPGSPNLLQGGGTQRSEVSTKITVVTDPNAKVTTSQSVSGAPIKADVGEQRTEMP